jgi:dolichol-phosphate mannosyltransferase
MSGWVGFSRAEVPYDRHARHAGHSKFSPRRMVRFSLDAISSFSNVPLQAATLLGFVFSGVAFVCLLVVVVARLAGASVSGLSPALFAVLLLGGIQLITVGVIGEYVGRIYDEVKRRPLYVVAERLNMDDRAPDPPPLVSEARR